MKGAYGQLLGQQKQTYRFNGYYEINIKTKAFKTAKKYRNAHLWFGVRERCATVRVFAGGAGADVRNK